MDNLKFTSVLPALQVFDDPVEIVVKLRRVGLVRFAYLFNNRVPRHVLTPLRALPAYRKPAVRTQRHG